MIGRNLGHNPTKKKSQNRPISLLLFLFGTVFPFPVNISMCLPDVPCVWLSWPEWMRQPLQSSFSHSWEDADTSLLLHSVDILFWIHVRGRGATEKFGPLMKYDACVCVTRFSHRVHRKSSRWMNDVTSWPWAFFFLASTKSGMCSHHFNLNLFFFCHHDFSTQSGVSQ